MKNYIINEIKSQKITKKSHKKYQIVWIEDKNMA